MTHLEPLPTARAEELFALLQKASRDAATGLALDDRGVVLGTVPTDTDDPANGHQPHVLGDLDVHA
jgi:hypothetical protein